MKCNAMQFNSIQCNAMQCNAMQYNAMQCNWCNVIDANYIIMSLYKCYTNVLAGLYAKYIHNLLRMVRWIRWHCPPHRPSTLPLCYGWMFSTILDRVSEEETMYMVFFETPIRGTNSQALHRTGVFPPPPRVGSYRPYLIHCPRSVPYLLCYGVKSGWNC